MGYRQLRPRYFGMQRMAAGLAAARTGRRLRHRHDRHAAGADAVAQLPALLRRAFHRHLSGVLPANGSDADTAAACRPDPRYRRDLACRDRRRPRRRTGAMADRARAPCRFPVRTPGRVLDRTEEGRSRVAGFGVAATRALEARDTEIRCFALPEDRREPGP